MNDFQAKLHEHLDECVYWYQSAWEHDPNMQIVNNTITGRDPVLEDHESRMIKLFGGLRDSVDAIPAPVLAGIEDRRGILGNENSKRFLNWLSRLSAVSHSLPVRPILRKRLS